MPRAHSTNPNRAAKPVAGREHDEPDLMFDLACIGVLLLAVAALLTLPLALMMAPMSDATWLMGP